MLHHHSVGAVDEFLVGYERAYRRLTVEAVLSRYPVEVCDGVESAVCLTSADHAVARRFLKHDSAVLAPEFDDVGCLCFLVTLKLVSRHISGLYVLLVVGDDLFYLILGYSRRACLSAKRVHRGPSGENDILLRLNVGAVDVGGEDIDVVDKLCRDVTVEFLRRAHRAVPIAVDRAVAGDSRVGQKTEHFAVHTVLVPAVSGVLTHHLNALADNLGLRLALREGEIFIGEAQRYVG